MKYLVESKPKKGEEITSGWGSSAQIAANAEDSHARAKCRNFSVPRPVRIALRLEIELMLLVVSGWSVDKKDEPLQGQPFLPCRPGGHEKTPQLHQLRSKLSSPRSYALLNSLAFRIAQVVSFRKWECGGPCEEVGKGVKVIQAGGDDGLIPGYFVAHDPTTESIVVAHQGTDSRKILSILNDAQLLLRDINTKRFTSAKGKSIEVHDGFQKTFERTADEVVAAVQRGLTEFKVKKVHVMGHSLEIPSAGGAIATLDALLLKQELDSSIEVTTTVFGAPRIGNEEFADFVDETLAPTFTRITNQKDPIPRVPPRLFGYQHPSGEVHINAVNKEGQATDIVECEGQENESDGCPAVPYESLSVHSWLSVVKLSTLWNFLPVKELAIDILGRREPPDSLSDFDLIVIAREFGLPTWFQAGCEGIGKDFDEDIDIETDGVKVGMETSVRLYQLKNKMRRMIGTCKDGASQDRFLRDAFLSLFGQEVKELERKHKGDH
ncbi:hypothetical protein AAF712_014390 [Marasmius tenuissimus]|uniref:Fungal lipase-type domain-containing protein n=1 Tax=Marasmius tenuissimus TaxID=585030 RepID=A0ABR2ZDR2_9AGAR